MQKFLNLMDKLLAVVIGTLIIISCIVLIGYSVLQEDVHLLQFTTSNKEESTTTQVLVQSEDILQNTSYQNNQEADVNNKDPLVLKLIELARAYAEKDTLKTSHLLVELDASMNTSVHWQDLLFCIKTNCKETEFYEFIFENCNDVTEDKTIKNYLQLRQIWNSRDVLRRAMLITEIDNAIKDDSTRQLWEEIIRCDQKCPQRYELELDFLQALAE